MVQLSCPFKFLTAFVAFSLPISIDAQPIRVEKSMLSVGHPSVKYADYMHHTQSLALSRRYYDVILVPGYKGNEDFADILIKGISIGGNHPHGPSEKGGKPGAKGEKEKSEEKGGKGEGEKGKGEAREGKSGEEHSKGGKPGEDEAGRSGASDEKGGKPKKEIQDNAQSSGEGEGKSGGEDKKRLSGEEGGKFSGKEGGGKPKGGEEGKSGGTRGPSEARG